MILKKGKAATERQLIGISWPVRFAAGHALSHFVQFNALVQND